MPVFKAKAAAPPKEIEERIKRGRKRMQEDANLRRLCWKFWKGEWFHYLDSKANLQTQPTTVTPYGTGKPRHVVRNAWNLISPIVEGKVSAATRRVPNYEVNPSTPDPNDRGAAKVAEKVAIYGHDKWRVRKTAVDCVTYAIVHGEGFAWPYFDNTVGPYIDVTDENGEPTGEKVGAGEVKIRTFGGNQCYWEPGCSFEDSRWWALEEARPVDVVEEMDGYIGQGLAADASTGDLPVTKSEVAEGKQVLVTEYLERPCAKYPEGRWLTLANGKVICEPKAYPCRDHQGNVVDEPVIHRLSYINDPESDRNRGLVEQLIDPARTYADCNSRISEWKNLMMAPQLFVHPGALQGQKITNEPGAVYYVPQPNENVKVRDVPPVPAELFTMMEDAAKALQRIANDEDIPSQVESSKAISAVIERGENRWQQFIIELADWYGRVMRHCLYLVQRHYAEERTLQIKGRFGWDAVKDFKGADLHGQMDVRVGPGSIEPRSKAAVEQRVMTFAQMGWITPQAAMTAINGGIAETLVEEYELFVKAANDAIQQIVAMPHGPEGGGDVPIVKKFTNPDVELQVFRAWAMSEEWDRLHPFQQMVAEAYMASLEFIKVQREMEALQAQEAQAAQLGLANASKPQTPSPPPDLPQAA